MCSVVDLSDLFVEPDSSRGSWSPGLFLIVSMRLNGAKSVGEPS